MRERIVAQRSLFDRAIYLLLSIWKPNKELKAMDKIIAANPEMVKAVQVDLNGDLKAHGRRGMSAERVLRSAILKQRKGYSYRSLRDHINESVAYRWFTRFFSDNVPHFTKFHEAMKAISSDTWQKINDILVQYAKDNKVEDGKYLRTDTTVVETNIAYPIDARLLSDSIRVLTRIMEACREILPELIFAFAKRTRRAKKRCYAIVMAKGPKAQQIRLRHYKDLLKVAHEVLRMAQSCHEHLLRSPAREARALSADLEHYLALARKAIDQCERRLFKGEKVPATEKIVSIFEEHTDIIKRGKKKSPTEFGHKVLISTGKSGLITQYEIFRGNPGDEGMLGDILLRHTEQYGKAPQRLSGDRRFFSSDNETLAYGSGVKKVCISKPGYRSKARQRTEKERWFKQGLRFRAGIEGIISVLMRSYGFKRCVWKGWESFKSYVGLSVVAFNLQKIATLT
jgi:IS5 family transposase